MGRRSRSIGPAVGAWLLAGMIPQAGALEYRDAADGVSCRHFDVSLGLAWPKRQPTWLDADGRTDGPRAFTMATLPAAAQDRPHRIDVTPLVKRWWDGSLPNDGLLLRLLNGSAMVFESRESTEIASRPGLRLQFADGRVRWLGATADAALDCSTLKGLGELPTLVMQPHAPLALRFDIQSARGGEAAEPVRADLVLVRAAASPRPPSEVGVFALDVPQRRDGAVPGPGLAARYPGDRGIARDADVLFADGFDGGRMSKRWASGPREGRGTVVEPGDEDGSVPLDGPALRVTIPARQQLGLDLRYRFRDHHGSPEPESLHLRYYLWLDTGWLRAVDGAKLPGFAGTYGVAGWGGRKWDGAKGWSMRGLVSAPLPAGHVHGGQLVIGSYAYHSRSETYGEHVPWGGGGFGAVVATGRWICIEQALRLNTPGQDDGTFTAWIDGREVIRLQGLRLRDLPHIRIEELWMNVFHGGTAVAPVALKAYVDRVVIARRYIGPAAP